MSTCSPSIGLHDLALLVPHGLGVEGHGRLHRHQAHHLKEVVLDHVAQRARLLVVAAAPLHTDLLGHRELHLGHVVAVPQRLEDAVGEAQGQDVLDRLLAEVVIDPVDLLLPEHAGDQLVQLLGRAQVVAERLLDDDARPAVLLGGQPGLAELQRDVCRSRAYSSGPVGSPAT